MSQSWRSYGSINKFETSNNVSLNNLTVDHFAMKNSYLGLFKINGTLNVSELSNFNSGITVNGNSVFNGPLLYINGATLMSKELEILGNTHILQNLYVDGDFTVGGTLQFEGSVASGGNLLAVGTTIMMGYQGKKGNEGTLIFNTEVNGGFMGINIPLDSSNVLPGTTLEVNNKSTQPTSLYVHSVNETSQSVLTSNNHQQGLIALVDNEECSINMFLNTPFSTYQRTDTSYVVTHVNKATDNDTIDAKITYDVHGKMSFTGQTRLAIPSSISIGQDLPPTQFNETLSLYTDIKSNPNPFLYDLYNVNSTKYSTWNTLSVLAPYNSSNTFINVFTPSGEGLRMGGGTYINDSNRSVGIMGITIDDQSNWVPTQMIVSGTNKAYCKTTTGFNTYAPSTEAYTLDINGAVSITNGEITKITEFPNEIVGITSCRRNRSHAIAFGSVSEINSDKYSHYVYYTNDTGFTWKRTDEFGVESGLGGDSRGGYSACMYDDNYSIVAFYSNIYVSTDGNNTWGTLGVNIPIGSTLLSFQGISRDIKIFNIPNHIDRDGILIVYMFKENTKDNEYIVYAYLSNISNIANYVQMGSQKPFLNCHYLYVDSISTVHGIDGYDTSYVFFAGNRGILKYKINLNEIQSTTETVPSNANIIAKPVDSSWNIGTYQYNAMQTYKEYDTSGNLLPDSYFTVFVGNGIITTTTDGGHSFYDFSTNITHVVFKSVYIHNNTKAIASGTNGAIYVTHDRGQTWSAPNNEFKSAGLNNILMNDLTTVCMTSHDDFIVARVDTSYNNIVGAPVPNTKIFYCHLPTLFNRDNTSVLDICGSMQVMGSTYIQDHVNIDGYLTTKSGTVKINQSFMDSYSPTSGVMVVNGGIGVTGNITTSANMNVGQNIYTESILANGGEAHNLLTISSDNPGCVITIGKAGDSVYFEGITRTKGSLSTVKNTMQISVESSETDIPAYTGITIGNLIVGADTSYNFPSYIITDNSNHGFLFKSPGSNTSIDLLLHDITLNAGVTSGLVSIQKYTPNNPGLLDPSFIISCNPDIDIGDIVLTSSVNGSEQNIGTDVTIGGKLRVQGSDSGIMINDKYTNSNSTGSGTVIVQGGLGVSGTANITTLNVTSGGANITGASSVNGSFTINSGANSSSAADGGALTVAGGTSILNDLRVGQNIYSDHNVYYNNQSGNPINLSMTDFSNNVTFYSNEEATNASSGTLRIHGGMGVSGNIYTAGNVVILGNIETNDYKKGSLIVTGGVGIRANTYIGGNVKICSNYESTDASSGALQILGGAGIKGNAHVGGNVVIYGTTQSIDVSSGSLQVKGGVGIKKDVFVGGNVNIVSKNDSFSVGTGSLQVGGGAGIKGNVHIGGNTVFTGTIQVNSMVESTSSYTGSIDTVGGVGIQGNLFVDNQMYIGSQVNLLSGLVAYYPLDVDYQNYVSGYPVSDLLVNNAAYTYSILSNNVNKCIGPSTASVFDVCYCVTPNPINSTVVYLYASNTGSLINSLRKLTSMTVSFWLNVGAYNPTLNETAILFDFNHSLSGVGTGIPTFSTTFSLKLNNNQQLIVLPSPAIAQSNGSTNLIGTNTWRMVTVVVDNTLVMKGSSTDNNTFLYIDGVYDSSWGSIPLNYIDVETSKDTTINTFGFGNTNSPGATAIKYYHYYLDDFRIYDRPLSPIEIKQLYDSSGLAMYTVNNVYTETRSMNPDNTTFSHTYGSVSSYQTLSVPTNTALAVTGNLAVTGATNIRGNTQMLGDLVINGNIIQNGYRIGRYLTDSSMIIAGDGGYFGGNLTSGNVYLRKLTLGMGGYFGGNIADGSINLMGINVGMGGFYGGNALAGNISVCNILVGNAPSIDISSGALQVWGGAGIKGNLFLGGNIMIQSQATSTDASSGALQVWGGAGIKGNVYIGSTTSAGFATLGKGALVVGGGVYTKGNVYIDCSASTSITDASRGALVVAGGVYTGGNIYIASTASTISTTTGSLIVAGGMGIAGNICSSGNVVIQNTTISTDASSGALQVWGGAGIKGNVYIGSTTSAGFATLGKGALVVGGGVYTQGNVYIDCSASTSITDASKGALVVAGGVYTGGNVYIGSTAFSNSTTTGSLIVAGGMGIAGNICCSGNVIIQNTTASTDASSGALQVWGGMGVKGSINTTGSVTIKNTQLSTSSTTGALQVTGGIGVGGNVYIACTGSVDPTTASTPNTIPTSGALTVAGGTYIAGDLVVGGYITNLTPSTSKDITNGTTRVNNLISKNATIGFCNLVGKTNSGTLTIDVEKITCSNGTGAINIDKYITLCGGSTSVESTVTNKNLSVYGLTAGSGGVGGGSTTAGDLSLNTLKVGSGGISTTGTISTTNTITTTGAITGGSFNASSDYRIKTNVLDLDETFTIDHLRPVKYTNTQTHKEDMGFIAHEVQEEFPFLVSGNKDDDNYQSLNYIGLISVLVHEVKQLKKRIQTLESSRGTYD